jgi:hypothetical protein
MAIMPIERGKIREYATATGAARPAYLDDPKAPVPPTFLATVVFWTPIGSPSGRPCRATTWPTTAAADLETGTVLAITTVARVLPYDECPLARSPGSSPPPEAS